MNTDRNGVDREYDLATVRSEISAINSTLSAQAATLSAHTASLAELKASISALWRKIDVLEDDVTKLKIDVAVILSNYVTKADLAKLETRMAHLEAGLLKWFIATWIAMAGTTFAIVKFVH